MVLCDFYLNLQLVCSSAKAQKTNKKFRKGMIL